MFKQFRSHAAVLGVAAAALTVGLIAPAAGHGVQHALFAHNAGKLDGLDSTAFARSSVLKTVHAGNSWVAYGSGPTTFTRYISGVEVSPDGSVLLPLDAPAYLNLKTLGLAKLELCYWTTGTAYINSVTIYATEVGDAPFIFSNPTDRSTGTTDIRCDAITVNRSLHKGGSVWVQLAGTGAVRLEGARATWSSAANQPAPRQAGRLSARANH